MNKCKWQHLFEKFHAGDFLLNDPPWLGRAVSVGINQIKTFIENHQPYTIWETDNLFELLELNVENNFHRFGFIGYLEPFF